MGVKVIRHIRGGEQAEHVYDQADGWVFVEDGDRLQVTDSENDRVVAEFTDAEDVDRVEVVDDES